MTEPAPRPGAISMPLAIVTIVVLLMAIVFDCLVPATANAAVDDEAHPALTQEQRTLLDLLGPGVVGEPVELPDIGHVRHWYPLEAQRGMYQNASGSAKGQVREVSLRWVKRDPKQPGAAGTGAWRLHSHGSNIKYLTEIKGHLRLPTEIDLQHGVMTVFDPPEPILLADVMEGESRVIDLQVSVYDLHNPKQLRYTGSVQETYTNGRYMVHIPRGIYPARLISVRTEGKVGPATSDRRSRVLRQGRRSDRLHRAQHISAFCCTTRRHRSVWFYREVRSPPNAGRRAPPAAPSRVRSATGGVDSCPQCFDSCCPCSMASVVISEPVNTICPMMTDEKIVDEDNVVEFNGQQIGCAAPSASGNGTSSMTPHGRPS